MNLATPAPKVETVKVAPAMREVSEADVDPPFIVEAAYAEPARSVEPAELVDDPRKFAPANALNNMREQQKSKIGVETLREQGVDFEGRAGICRGAPKKNFLKLAMPLLFDQRDYITFSEIARYLVVQGGCCFVFLDPTDPSPLYAFSLHELTAERENLDKPDKASFTVNPVSNTNKQHASLVNVLLRYKKNGKLAFQVVFDTDKEPGVVKVFLEVVRWYGKGAAETIQATVQEAESAAMTKKGKK